MATLTINTGTKAFSVEPAHKGVTESSEKIWSSNTGRVASGKMTGDIVAIKKKLVVQWPPLTENQKNALDTAVSDAFFPVTYKGRTYTMYGGSPTYQLYSMAKGLPRYYGVSVELIEQ